MIINGSTLLANSPILEMVHSKTSGPGGTSYGLGEAGYDIRIKQSIRFIKDDVYGICVRVGEGDAKTWEKGRFILASAMEEFDMPANMCGIVHDKSTWARRGLSVFNTVIEPGWRGFLTLELVYHGQGELIIPAGAGIAQVIFHQLLNHEVYTGKYQDQPDQPVGPIESK